MKLDSLRSNSLIDTARSKQWVERHLRFLRPYVWQAPVGIELLRSPNEEQPLLVLQLLPVNFVYVCVGVWT